MSWDLLNRVDMNVRYQTLGPFIHLLGCWLPDILGQNLPIASRTSKMFADALLERSTVKKELGSGYLVCENWNP